MPKNKRESIIYSVMMCFCMVLWMSIYNVSCAQGGLSFGSVQQGWMGMPIAYIVALCLDLLLVSKLAKGIAFRFFLKPESSERKKVLVISSCIVVPMVIFMSLFGAVEMACHDPLDVVMQYPKELYHGLALPIAAGRTFGALGIPPAIPGRNRFGRLIRNRNKKESFTDICLVELSFFKI